MFPNIHLELDGNIRTFIKNNFEKDPLDMEMLQYAMIRYQDGGLHFFKAIAPYKYDQERGKSLTLDLKVPILDGEAL